MESRFNFEDGVACIWMFYVLINENGRDDERIWGSLLSGFNQGC